MDKAIKVSLEKFLVEVFENGAVVKTIDQCAFGRDGHHTPEISGGSLSMTKRDAMHHSTIYNGAAMPFALFFEQDPSCAFHEGPVHVASHGCIHLSGLDAEWLFNWAAHDPVKLDIDGPYPEPPVR